MKNKLLENKFIYWIFLGIVSVFWGLTFLFSDIALKYLGVIGILAIRWSIAAFLFLMLKFLSVIKLEFKNKPLKYVVLCALFQPCLYAILELIGIDYTTSSESTLIIALVPIMVIVLSRIILKEKYDFKINFAVALAFIGVFISIYFAPGFTIGGKGIGYICLLGAVLCAGFFTISIKKAYDYFSAVEVTVIMAISGAVFFNIIAFIKGEAIESWTNFFTSIDAFLPTMYLALCGSFVSYFLFNLVLKKIPQGIASCLQSNGITLVGVVAGIVVAGDDFGWYTVVGMALVIAGIAIATLEGEHEIEEHEETENSDE